VCSPEGGKVKKGAKTTFTHGKKGHGVVFGQLKKSGRGVGSKKYETKIKERNDARNQRLKAKIRPRSKSLWSRPSKPGALRGDKAGNPVEGGNVAHYTDFACGNVGGGGGAPTLANRP